MLEHILLDILHRPDIAMECLVNIIDSVYINISLYFRTKECALSHIVMLVVVVVFQSSIFQFQLN